MISDGFSVLSGSSDITSVEVRGLEPLASSVRGRRSTRLSYTPGKLVKRTTQRVTDLSSRER